ncbi:hypothetical protein NLG97_g4928 [Lecanicillium saksenae]|uniref:Uncharacterized protein n=1 Tax=Lecanicillium saksenae TaxID=468837 RepID=A0ACC1QTV2_9HYPO|nr:hypothetical protein NLG97_g4928 [Lecanicillium saksenae]
MQILSAAVFLAAAAAAAPSASEKVFGTRYTDSNCKKVHSLPNRDFKAGECIDKTTVHSLKFPTDKVQCYIFQTRECKGNWFWFTPPVKGCMGMDSLDWDGARSFICQPHPGN